MSNHPIAIKKYFTVVSETNVNIAKAVTLAHNVFARLDTEKIELEVSNYNEYEYITETQYKNILGKLTAEGKIDFSSDAAPNSVLESHVATDLIREKAALVSKVIQMPVVSYALASTDKKLVDSYRKLYKHYEYMLDVVFADVLDSGGRMTPLQMKQMNIINKEINKTKLWAM